MDSTRKITEKIYDLTKYREKQQQVGFTPIFDNCEKHGRWQSNVLSDDGRARFLPQCTQCKREQLLEREFGRAAIPERFNGRSLDSYIAETQSQKRALMICQRYVASFTDKAAKTGACLVFSGKPGTGKSHLACGAAQEVIKQGCTALYVTAGEIFRRVKATYRDKAKEDEEGVYKALTAYDLLIIDEIGLQRGTEFELETMSNVIDKRNLAVKPMIVLTNLEIEPNCDGQTLERYIGERAFDRLCDGGFAMKFDWESYRRRK